MPTPLATLYTEYIAFLVRTDSPITDAAGLLTRLRALAVSAPQRLSQLYADTPTWQELGIDCVIGTWRGVIGADGLEAAQVAWWEHALGKVATSAAWQEELRHQYWLDTWAGADATRELLERERGMLADLLTGLGLRP
ncbi:MAG: tripartite tricarboxylate transporter substrate-binding protein [Burkholderiales bacterium]|nr:tripartite tricarboxylate transporter substrate-binding protein [Burkholderiales bacterium]